MKIRSTLALLLALPVAAPFLAMADDAPAPAAPATTTTTTTVTTAPAAAPDEDKDTELELRMKRIAKAFRALKKQVADPAQNASSLDLAAKMMAAAKEAEDLTPKKAADLLEDQKAKFMSDYKAGIQAMEDEISKLSDALTAGKNDVATAIVADMFSLEKKSHKEFKKPDKS
jgi:soluble cytochrome b562